MPYGKNRLNSLFIVVTLLWNCTGTTESNVVRYTYYFEKYFKESTIPDDYLIMTVIDSLHEKKRFVKVYDISRDSSDSSIGGYEIHYTLVSGDTLLYVGNYDEAEGIGFLTKFHKAGCDTIVNPRDWEFNCYQGKKNIITSNGENMEVHHIKRSIIADYGLLEFEDYYDKHMILVKEELTGKIHANPYRLERVEDLPDFVKKKVVRLP